jgi:hypothetical protein
LLDGKALREIEAACRRRRFEKLLELAGRHGESTPNGIRIRLPLTQYDLGRMLGLSRTSLYRQLNRLAARGLVSFDRDGFVLPVPRPGASKAARMRWDAQPVAVRARRRSLKNARGWSFGALRWSCPLYTPISRSLALTRTQTGRDGQALLRGSRAEAPGRDAEKEKEPWSIGPSHSPRRRGERFGDCSRIG